MSRGYHVPVIRPFPIWRYGPVHDIIDGRSLGDQWFPDRLQVRTFATREEAEAFVLRRAVIDAERIVP